MIQLKILSHTYKVSSPFMSLAVPKTPFKLSFKISYKNSWSRFLWVYGPAFVYYWQWGRFWVGLTNRKFPMIHSAERTILDQYQFNFLPMSYNYFYYNISLLISNSMSILIPYAKFCTCKVPHMVITWDKTLVRQLKLNKKNIFGEKSVAPAI